ncbi:ABC transporter transmembrane domain-containing protein [Hathewaya limosa]|uniref:ATP-binding cassette subfamily C protein n=1 Tax=Hathewaya limosa TaxID=1536 RepID=A0ABU0JXG1_HATLI|nr:ABC transporter ATP-binding protein [Hathewaya limosa]MDQ0480941.1 ATP-binding cassette subfamily C protein [Hathewaya limosa]
MNIFKFIKKYLKNYKIYIILFCMFSTIIKFTSFFIPYILGKFIDSMILNKSVDMVLNYSKGIILIAFIELVSIYSREMIGIKLSSQLSFNIIDSIVEHLKRLPIDYFRDLDTVYLNQRINQDVGLIVKFVTNSTVELFLQLACVIILIFFTYNINLWFSVSIIIILIINFIIYTVFKKIIYKNGYELQESQNKFFSKVNDQFSIIKSIKRHSWFKKLNNEIKENFSSFYKNAIRYTKITSLYNAIGNLFKYVCIVFLVMYGGRQIINNKMSIGDFIILNSYFLMLLEWVRFILSFGEQYQSSIVAYDRIMDIINIKEEHNGQKFIESIDSICIKDLTFNYGKNFIVKNFNFMFEKGNVYCIEGQNGKGKSTLIDLITGLRYDYKGEIYYNHINIKDLNIYDIRRKLMGIVEQEPNLAKDSIVNNLVYDLEGYEDKKLHSLCDSMNISKFISNKNEDNLNTNFSNISGGEKQKIAEIRAILKNPEVLILDEPISALDQESIIVLKSILNDIKKDCIIIIITHNDMILDIVDKVIKL